MKEGLDDMEGLEASGGGPGRDIEDEECKEELADPPDATRLRMNTAVHR